MTLPDGPVRGYVCELYQGHYQLLELGPIGSNCLANSRDFQAPIAAFDDDEEEPSEYKVFSKFNNTLLRAPESYSIRRRCLARQLLPVQIRSWPIQHYWINLIRQPRSLHLHSFHWTIRPCWHRHRRLCHLSTSLDGRREHFPSSVVPSQHHVGVHGSY